MLASIGGEEARDSGGAAVLPSVASITVARLLRLSPHVQCVPYHCNGRGFDPFMA
jgi:hypothetical protein